MSKLTYVITYYNQPFIEKQLELWSSYPSDVLSQLEFVMVDDGSKTRPLAPIVRPYKNKLSIKLFVITKDIYWNIPGAINLGMCMTNTPWAFHADVDNWVAAESMSEIMDAIENEENELYDFVVHIGERVANNTSSFLLTRDLFWKIGGYDEDFSGQYGHDDIYFKYECEFRGHKSVPLHDIKINMIYEGRVVELDNPEDKESEPSRLMLQDKKEPYKPHRPKRILRFPWKQIIL